MYFKVKFVCYFNDLTRGSSWGGSQEKAEESVENRKMAYVKMLRKLKETEQSMPEYFVESTNTDLIEGYVDGTFVYKVPEKIKEDVFEGVFDQYDVEDFECVGVLLKVDKKWIIIQNNEKLELMRRQIHIERIKKGKLQFSNYCNKDDEKDPTPYINHLKEIDEENGGNTGRSHDLMLSNAVMSTSVTVNDVIDVNSFI